MMPRSCAASQRVADLTGDRDRFVEWDGPAADPLGEVFAFDQLHDQRAGRLAVFETVDLRDVGMIERRERRGLRGQNGRGVRDPY